MKSLSISSSFAGASNATTKTSNKSLALDITKAEASAARQVQRSGNRKKAGVSIKQFRAPGHDDSKAENKYRWRVELFFKWIKQHLRIKAFFGETENAVKTQIWSAVCVYVLVAVVKKRLAIKASLYEMLQILRVSPSSKKPSF